jgi:hypothetical protein
MRRLFTCYVSCDCHGKNRGATDGCKIVRRAETWWHPQNSGQAGLWRSSLTVFAQFYDEVMASPILTAKAAPRQPPPRAGEIRLLLYSGTGYGSCYGTKKRTYSS